MTCDLPLVRCIYCDRDVAEDALTDEHIWPDALGGNALPSFWRTRVCGVCNSVSGVFVDGAFIKSWLGAAERAVGADLYLAAGSPEKAVLPFNYIGTLTDPGVKDGEVLDYWVGRCGSSVLHFRPKGEDGLWSTYAGGDPRKGSKRKTAGRAYLAMLSPVPFWQAVGLNSFRVQFKKADRFRCTNLDPSLTSDIPIPDKNDAVQSGDIEVLARLLRAEEIKADASIDNSVGTRLQAKLALALGFKIFGNSFLKTEYAKALRTSFREADPAKRPTSLVRGAGILSLGKLGGSEEKLRWLGGWLLWLKRQGDDTVLIVISPSAKVMMVVVSDDHALTNSLPPEHQTGLVWITVPSIEESVGPIAAPDYVAHQLGNIQHPALAALEAKRVGASSIPDCGLRHQP